MTKGFDKSKYRSNDPEFLFNAQMSGGARYKVSYGDVCRAIEAYPELGVWFPGYTLTRLDLDYYAGLRRISGCDNTGSDIAVMAAASLTRQIKRLLSQAIFTASRVVTTSRVKVSIKLEYVSKEGDKYFFKHYGSVYRARMSEKKAIELFGTLGPEPGMEVRFLGKTKSSLDGRAYPKHPYFGTLTGRFFPV